MLNYNEHYRNSNVPLTNTTNFIKQLREAKVNTAQLFNNICCLTENTRVQAKAATEL